MFHFPASPPHQLFHSPVGDHAQPWPGYPIRTPSDQRSIDNSPRLNAAFHVLHRLSIPRHPPCALPTQQHTQTIKMLASTIQFHKQHQNNHNTHPNQPNKHIRSIRTCTPCLPQTPNSAPRMPHHHQPTTTIKLQPTVWKSTWKNKKQNSAAHNFQRPPPTATTTHSTTQISSLERR